MIFVKRLRAAHLALWAYMLASTVTPASAEISDDPICLPLHGNLGGIVGIEVVPEITALTVSVGRVIGRGPARPLTILPNCDDDRPQSGCVGSRTLPIPGGSTVVILKSAKGYRCVSTADRNDHTTGIGGWVSEKRVSVYPKWPAVPTRSWVGVWIMEGNSIQVTVVEDGFLEVVGSARYHARDGVDEGYFKDRLRPAGALVDLSSVDLRSGSDQCSISMGLVAGMLAVFDQGGQCDGNNVSFTGIYTRQEGSK